MTIRIIIAMMMLQFFVNEAVAQYVIGQKIHCFEWHEIHNGE